MEIQENLECYLAQNIVLNVQLQKLVILFNFWILL